MLKAMTLRWAMTAALLPLAAGYTYDLTEDNFERLIFQKQAAQGTLGHTAAFIKFYTPWCAHCKKMAPAWKAVEDAHEGSRRLLVGNVDCAEAGGGSHGMTKSTV